MVDDADPQTVLERLLRLDLGYPGLSFGYESWALETYLNVLTEYSSFAQGQYRLRAQRALDKEAPQLEPEEVAHRTALIDEAAETQIPRFFRIGALIPIWGLFESFVVDIAHYVGKRENMALSLRDVRAPNLRIQIERYFEDVLRVQLPWSKEERSRLGYLQELRNFVAHRNGRVTDLSADKRKSIDLLVCSVSGLTIEGGALMVSSDYIQEAATLVFDLVAKLNQLVGDRYDGPTVPKSET